MNTVSFFTPVIRPNNSLMNAIEKYTWFKGKVAEVIVLSNGDTVAFERDEPSGVLGTALKIVSMILTLGVLPLFALIARAISRCYHGDVLVPDSADVNKQIADLRERTRILDNQYIQVAEKFIEITAETAHLREVSPLDLTFACEWVKNEKAYDESGLDEDLRGDYLDDVNLLRKENFKLLQAKQPTIESDMNNLFRQLSTIF